MESFIIGSSDSQNCGISVIWGCDVVGFPLMMRTRPRKPPDGFHYICRGEAPTALKLGSSVGIGAPHGGNVLLKNVLHFLLYFPASEGPHAETHGCRYRMHQYKEEYEQCFPRLFKEHMYNFFSRKSNIGCTFLALTLNTPEKDVSILKASSWEFARLKLTSSYKRANVHADS